MFKGRKGIEKEMLVLSAVAVGIVILGIFMNRGIAEAGKHSIDVTSCRASVDRNARLHINGVEFPTSVNCPARRVSISDVGNDKAMEEANRRIADEMYNCWYQFGEGKLNLFNDEATFCSVCAFIDVKSDKQVVGLGDYLLNNDIPDGSGILYADYLSGHSTPKAKDILGELAEKRPEYLEDAARQELKAQSTQAVIFVYAKGRHEIEEIVLNNFFARTGAGEVALKGSLLFGAYAGAGTFATLVVIGGVSGPVGWIALGAGATAFGAAQVVSFFSSPDNVPEWFSFVVVREWEGNMLKDELGCDYFPSKLE